MLYIMPLSPSLRLLSHIHGVYFDADDDSRDDFEDEIMYER